MSTTLYLPMDNRGNLEWFRDLEGVWTTCKHKDEVKTYVFDYTNQLDSSETLSTSTWQNASGVTSSGASSSATPPTATVTITGTDGSIENKITTSSGQTKIYLYRFVGVPLGRHRTGSDYGV